MKRLAASITLVAVLALGAVAVARGGGVYSGPTAQPPMFSDQPPPSIQLTVQTRHAAVTITQTNLFNGHFHCEGLAGELATGTGSATLWKNVLGQIKVKPRQRTFKSTQGFEEGHLFITLTGKLLRNGSAQGTVRFWAADGGTAETYPAVGDAPPQIVQLGRCDSGTFTWSATRQ